MTAARRVDIGQIVDALSARIDVLVCDLFPAGVQDGPEYRVGSLAGEPGKSLAIRLKGARRGVWCDFASGEKGDALDLVAMTLFGRAEKPKAEALRWARSWLGEGGHDHERMATTRRAVQPKVAKATSQADEDEAKRRRALAIWIGARESLKDTPAAAYLLGRGIDLGRLGRQPRALRFAPDLPNVESGRSWPALVAAITDGDGRHVATHRTWLEVRAGGRVAKAPLEDAKMTLGRYAGGAIRLWRGAGGKPLREAAPASAVVLTEGIEDGLSIAQACPDRRVLAAVSLANMAGLVLPSAIATVVIAAQNDAPGSSAALALAAAAAAFAGQGRSVLLARPPASVKDANDLLNAAPVLGPPAPGVR